MEVPALLHGNGTWFNKKRNVNVIQEANVTFS
jgi:hypothetical protein